MISGLASLQSGTVDVDIPVYMTYHMGGANSIRGYDVLELGKKIFGKNQLIGTAEYSFTVLPLRRWDVWKFAFRLGLDFALFADVGTAWSESSELTKEPHPRRRRGRTAPARAGRGDGPARCGLERAGGLPVPYRGRHQTGGATQPSAVMEHSGSRLVSVLRLVFGFVLVRNI